MAMLFLKPSSTMALLPEDDQNKKRPWTANNNCCFFGAFAYP